MRDPRFSSPTPRPADTSRRMSAVPNMSVLGAALIGDKAMLQPASAFKLQPPEEQTDNWDDDFEEGISSAKLHCLRILFFRVKLLDLTCQYVFPALDKTTSDEKNGFGNNALKVDRDETENIKTIKPDAKTASSLRSLRKITPPEMRPIIEDYSDLAGDDEGEDFLLEKVASFKVRLVASPIFGPWVA